MYFYIEHIDSEHSKNKNNLNRESKPDPLASRTIMSTSTHSDSST